MKLSLEFFKAFGCGVDGSSDVLCWDGYNKVAAQNYPEIFDYWAMVNDVKTWYNNGEITEAHYKRWLDWLYRLQKNIHAIEYWGDAVYHDQYKVKKNDDLLKEFTSLESAQQYKKDLITRELSNIFDHVNVLKLYPSDSGFITTVVKSWNDITNGFNYKVHNPQTGAFIDCVGQETTRESINVIFEKIKERHNIIFKIEQKVSDPDDGFSAWKIIG